MSTRVRVALFAAITVLVVAGTTAYALDQLRDSRAQRATPPSVPSAEPNAMPDDEVIAFRHTGVDSEYGVVAVVSRTEPDGARSFTGAVCDRVYATRLGASCLSTDRGVVTTYEDQHLDPDWNLVSTQPLAGIPSRTRISPDGSLVATTSFVTGHSYMTIGFSTATEIHSSDRTMSSGNLERFALFLDGKKVAPPDRNIWGVTFADDDRTFYATVGTAGRTYLVEGDLQERTLTSIVEAVECPSLSPDGTRIAFKQLGTVAGGKGWTPAVFDLATRERTVLTGETRSVDDQIEWLDDQTILYGLARPDEPGVTDVWSLRTSPDATPQLFIEQAWSPTVLRR